MPHTYLDELVVIVAGIVLLLVGYRHRLVERFGQLGRTAVMALGAVATVLGIVDLLY